MPDTFKRSSGRRIWCLGQDAPLTALDIAFNLTLHSRPKEALSREVNCSRLPLMTGQVMHTTQGLLHQAPGQDKLVSPLLAHGILSDSVEHSINDFKSLPLSDKDQGI